MKRKTTAAQEVRPANELPAGKLRVNMSNALVTAAQRLSLAEKRVLSFAVASLNTFSHNGGADGGMVKLSAHRYAEQFGVDPDTAYDQLQSCAESIITKQVWWYEEAKRGIKKKQINWLGAAEYYKGEGTVSLWFTAQIAPHLLQLKGQFTTYQLAQASALRSVYSWRLLELLSQFESTGWRQIELDEFHHAMETPNSYRANFKDCRCWVIAPAVKELQEKDGWLIDWTPIKTGRKVTALRFEFKRDPQGQLAL